MRDQWSGRTQRPGNAAWARAMSTTRQYITATRLGSAVFSSVSDFNTQQMAVGFMGLSRTGPVKNLVKLMSSDEFRNAASEMGLILENAVDTGMAAQRYSMEDFHSEVAGRIADGVLRATGLSGLTQMQRDAFGMTVMEGFASLSSKKWDDLPQKPREAMESYGIGADDWENIRSAKKYSVGGSSFLRPKEIEEAAGLDAAMNFMEMVIGQREFAVPSSSVRAKSALQDKARPGTVGGEAIRSLAQFKTFPLLMIFTHISRIVDMVNKGRALDAVTYGTGLVVGNTLLGIVALNLKELSKGRDPLDITKKETWGMAIAQGGGLGIFGDFLLADHNRFGGGIGQTLAGPTVGLAEDTFKLTVGNVQQAIRGEDTNFAAELADFAVDNNPLSSVWFSRLLFEREVSDRLMMALDPDARSKLSRKARNAETERSGYFFRPGRSLIDGDAVDAPDFAEFLGR